MFKIEITRTIQRFAGAVFIDTILQMLGHTVAGHKRHIGLFQFKFRIAQQAGDTHLDNPDPELLAAHRGAVQIHQNGFHRALQINRQHRIIHGISDSGFYTGQRTIAERNELHFAVARFHDVHNTVLANLEPAVLGDFQGTKAALAVDVAQIRDMNGLGNVHKSRILFFLCN